jgi:short-subunit dehydrogenase
MKKVAIVTGASQGIGAAIADMLVSEGYDVYGLSRRRSELAAYNYVPCDLTDSASIEQAVRTIAERENGQIDLLINDAGMGIAGAIEFAHPDDIARQLGVNLTGTMAITQKVLPYMRRRGAGKIIFISSLAAIFPLPYQAYYSVSKAGINAFSDALGIEVKPFGIQTSAMMLNDVKSEFTANRRKNLEGNDIYHGRIELSVHRMERSEQNGMSVQQIAAACRRLIRKDPMPPHVVVGAEGKLYAFLYRILPTRTMLAVIRKVYG